MTERGRGSLTRDATTLTIGPSSMEWTGESLRIQLDETTAPVPSAIRGTVTLYPESVLDHRFDLDAAGKHHWRPLATRARAEVELAKPGLRWRGEGYFDSNFGAEPLEDAFTDWRWSRAHLRRDTAVLYEGARRDGSRFALGLRFDAEGGVTDVELPPETILPRTGWRIARRTRADAGSTVLIRKTWEDTPFYARTALSTRLFGEAADAVHESLSLDRLRHPLVKAMLPFRMPRMLR